MLNHYLKRCGREVQTVQATFLVDTTQGAVINIHCSAKWPNGTNVGPQVACVPQGDLRSLAADKGYDDISLREEFRAEGVRPLINTASSRQRRLEDLVEIQSGGTDPADTIHEEVVEATAEAGVDIADKTPKYVADLDDLKDTDYLVTMGCSITKFNPAQYGVESREWDLVNPDGQDMETVREVRDEIER